MKQELCINCKLEEGCEMTKAFGPKNQIAVCHRRVGVWVPDEPQTETAVIKVGDKDEIQNT